LRLQRYIFFLN